MQFVDELRIKERPFSCASGAEKCVEKLSFTETFTVNEYKTEMRDVCLFILLRRPLFRGNVKRSLMGFKSFSTARSFECILAPPDPDERSSETNSAVSAVPDRLLRAAESFGAFHDSLNAAFDFDDWFHSLNEPSSSSFSFPRSGWISVFVMFYICQMFNLKVFFFFREQVAPLRL